MMLLLTGLIVGIYLGVIWTIAMDILDKMEIGQTKSGFFGGLFLGIVMTITIMMIIDVSRRGILTLLEMVK